MYRAILHTFEPEELIEVFELRRTAGGQPRARTSRGWVSVISQNGKRLLKQVRHWPKSPDSRVQTDLELTYN